MKTHEGPVTLWSSLDLVRRGIPILLAIIALAGWSGSTLGAHPPVPDDQAVTILHKALHYDENLASKRGREINLAILYFGERSARRAKSVAAALSAVTQDQMRPDVGFNYWILQYTGAGLDAFIKGQNISSLYVVTDSDHTMSQLGEIRDIARSNETLTVVDDPALVASHFALSLNFETNRAKLWINLDRSKQLGSRFSPAFLKLCHVVDR